MKGVVDRFSEDFVETRMKALDKFLKRVADHPVLSFNPHLNAFLTAKVGGKGGGNMDLCFYSDSPGPVFSGPQQTSGFSPADQSGRVCETRGGRIQAASAAGRVQRHGGIPGDVQPKTGKH